MANGNLINGLQTVGLETTSSDGVTICSWTVPINIFARIEADCILQKISGIECNSYKLAANVFLQDGYATIINTVSKFNEDGYTSGFEMTLDAAADSINVITASADGYTYRAGCAMKIYSILIEP